MILPSVTQLLKPLSSQIYKDIDKETLKTAATKGTAVHFAIELYSDTGLIQIESQYLGYFRAYQNWLDKYPHELLASEYKAFHKGLWYAGTADKIVNIKDENILIDVKTTASLNIPLVSVQLEAYKRALESQGMHIDKANILSLHEDETYDYIELKGNFDVFLACIKINNYLIKEGLKK
jgi:hypothetical protein